ncbi:Orotate phosphoribosyltransferase [archaeon HR06]|nr:Orotate phosphoribosyltransferase [archaeon HR06]
MDLVDELCKLLIKTDAIKFGIFTLSSGRLSSYYIDLRMVPSFPSAFRSLINIYTNLIKEWIGSFDLLAGIPTTGLIFTSAVAFKIKKPLVYVRKEKKEYGREKRVEGFFKPGDDILILDDLITSGSSIISTAKVLREEGARVNKALVLIDRLEGGKERLKEEGIKLYNLTDVLTITDRLYNLHLLTEEQRLAVYRQVKSKS